MGRGIAFLPITCPEPGARGRRRAPRFLSGGTAEAKPSRRGLLQGMRRDFGPQVNGILRGFRAFRRRVAGLHGTPWHQVDEQRKPRLTKSTKSIGFCVSKKTKGRSGLENLMGLDCRRQGGIEGEELLQGSTRRSAWIMSPNGRGDGSWSWETRRASSPRLQTGDAATEYIGATGQPSRISTPPGTRCG